MTQAYQISDRYVPKFVNIRLLYIFEITAGTLFVHKYKWEVGSQVTAAEQVVEL